jgi:hypothetical protein
VSGQVIVNTKSSFQHTGLSIKVDGSITLQLSARSVGLFDAFSSTLKPIVLVNHFQEVVGPGK